MLNIHHQYDFKSLRKRTLHRVQPQFNVLVLLAFIVRPLVTFAIVQQRCQPANVIVQLRDTLIQFFTLAVSYLIRPTSLKNLIYYDFFQ
jgi:hypothetical protein